MNKKKIVAGIFSYLLVFAIYIAFFSYPVTPAYIEHRGYVDVETKNISYLPNGVYKVYVKGSLNPAIVVIATIRTPYIPQKTYSKSLRHIEGIVEKEIKKRYNVNIDLVYRGEKSVDIKNHTIVMDDYDVYLNYTFYAPLRPKVIKLDIGAYFCQEKFESIIIAYAYPPIFASDFNKVLESIHC